MSDSPVEDRGSGVAIPGREGKSVLRSFGFAWEGISYVLKTERHMRVHVVMMTLVLIGAWGVGVTPYELLHLLAAFALVLIMEMVNTAIERVVDLTVQTYDPAAKVAKDVAAGAVLIAAAYSIAVWIIGVANSERFWQIISLLPEGSARPHLGAVQAVLIGAILMGVLITWLKMRTRRGTFWRGGVVSGHSALGFLIATSIVIMTRNAAIACLALALALLVSQSRIQARIHSPAEVLTGALLGILVAIVVFLPMPFGG